MNFFDGIASYLPSAALMARAHLVRLWRTMQKVTTLQTSRMKGTHQGKKATNLVLLNSSTRGKRRL
jgi:hypothetical protein